MSTHNPSGATDALSQERDEPNTTLKSHDTSPWADQVPIAHVRGVPVFGLWHIRPEKLQADGFTLVVFEALTTIYVVACILSEIRQGCFLSADSPSAELALVAGSKIKATALATKERYDGFDFVRFVFILVVVYGHFGYQLNARDGYIAAMLTKPNLRWVMMLESWPWMWMMSGFSFVSGAVTGRVRIFLTLARLCACLLATFMLINAVTWITPGSPKVIILVPYYLWFLLCLAAWQVTITPIFALFSRCGVPRFLIFIAVFCSTYYLHHSFEEDIWLFSISLGKLWGNALTLAPFYALGQIFSASDWAVILQKSWVMIASFIYFIAWHAILIIMVIANPLLIEVSEEALENVEGALKDTLGKEKGQALVNSFLQFVNDLTLWFQIDMDQFLDTAVYPHAWSPTSVSWRSFCINVMYFIMKMMTTFSVVCLLGGVIKPIKRVCPCIGNLLCRCGSRVIYCYILHFIFLEAGLRMGHYILLEKFPMPILASFGIIWSFVTTVVLCSTMTEWMFSRLLIC